MSASPDYDPAARQDYGTATSSEYVYEHVLEHKLANNMNVSSIRTPVLRAVPLSPADGDPEPDSTHPESIIQAARNKLDNEVEYHIAEKRHDTEMSVDTLSGLVRIEEGLDNVGRIAYPIMQEADDSGDGNYDSTTATLIQAPLNTAIVQNVTKLPQNFTINVDATVSNITAIQNVSQDGGNQTLWLPTILATSAGTSDSKIEEERSQSGVSQIIITSESYVNDSSQSGRRANIVTETSYIRTAPKSSKVQILSNISIPKSYSQQYVTQGKDIAPPVYGTQNHVYKLNTNVMSQKHLSNSVLCNKTPKSQSLIGCSLAPAVINSPIKNIAYSHTFTKSTNMKSLSKVNNGANLNAVVAASSGNTQCHILSRVVSGPNKMSVHSGRKSVNTLKQSKSSSQMGQKNQSRAIKIIQQTGSAHKSENKAWPVAGVATYKNQQPIYGVVESSTSKIIQKVGSPTHNKSHQQIQKLPSKGERLVLQSPCGPVLISTAPLSTSLPRGPHYVQSGAAPGLRYVQTYAPTDTQLSTVSQVSANQQLTAQILQSLAQPKLMLHAPAPAPLPPSALLVDEPVDPKPTNQRRVVFGDKSTLLTADDIIGMEERPNLSEELRRYSFHDLALVMLDHTYSQPAQKLPTPPAPPPAPAAPAPPPPRHSPVIVSTAAYELPPAAPVAAPPPPLAALAYKPAPPPPTDDDTASVISSVEGERAAGGSDTETAPEGEEEGKTRCVCDFTHDDGYMICCDRCGEWQHVDCMGIDRNKIPDAYQCELCQPRAVDARHARAIQLRKREELSALGEDTDDGDALSAPRPRRRLLTVTTYTDTSGSCVTTYNSPALASLPPAPAPPQPTPTQPKRGPKRPKKSEVVRKPTKRKLAEKRVKRKKEMMMNRSKFNSSVSSQSHWGESFEQAMTNHYSPELRAKIMKYSSKIGNTPGMAAAITAHLCTTVPHAGGKILIATKDLKENTPVIELRGKYMLSNQHRPQLQNSARAGSQKPGPFVFFYKLPKDNTQICIDTRTYGNEARFVRRSCKPNAELQHCIIKGALHVYLCTIGMVPSNTEITVGHDTNGIKQPCACGNPKHCKLNGLTSLAARKSVDYPPREKRSRNRCSSSSSALSPPLAPVLPSPVKDYPCPITPVKVEKKSPIKYDFSPMSPIKNSAIMALNFDQPMKATLEETKPEIDLTAKEEMKPEIDEPDYVKMEIDEKLPPEEPPTPEPEPEPEPVPIKKEIEPIKKETEVSPVPIAEEEKPITDQEIKPDPEITDEEKPIEQKQEAVKLEEVKEEVKEEVPKLELIKVETPKKEAKVEERERRTRMDDDRPATREYTAKSACHDRSSRSSRNTTCTNQDSLDDKTDDSQDKLPPTNKEKDKKKMTREERKMEAIMKAIERMEKEEQRKQEVKERQKRRESDPHPNAPEKDEDDDFNCSSKKRKKRKGRARTTSQSNRRRLNSADSDMVTSGDEAPHRTPPRAPPRRDSAPHNNEADRNDAINEDLGLSSACLLVEAAVGSVESAFKLPKTKKTMATEWIGRSPERTPSPYRSPYRPPLMSATSLESLVRVASTMIGDLSGGQDFNEEDRHSSPPRTPGRDRSRPPKKARRVTRSTPPTEVVETTPTVIPQHSAKKRWLRQAISEESDSPNAESPPSEIVTPLKKRRLARESLSYETNTVVPCNDEASPNLTSEESPVKEDSGPRRQYSERPDGACARDRSRSDSGPGSDDLADHEALCHVPHDSEHIRRIIGVPTPEEELPPKPNLDANYNTVVPMDIDTTVAPQPKLETADPVCDKTIENTSRSADTSGDSSPQRDEMDDIQKKIHSFHTENILFLKSRNKKPPKEKRKKVNLNFDLNMVDDQISIQLRTENDSSKSPEINGDVHDDMSDSALLALENIPLPDDPAPIPPLETIPLPEEPMRKIPHVESIPLPEDIPSLKGIPLPEEPMATPAPARDSAPFASRFGSTGLFSGIFANFSQPLADADPVPSIIKSAIDRTTSLDNSLFDKSCVDELKSVQEILTRVSNMDSNNSVLVSGVLQSAGRAPEPRQKPARANDPRLHPPPQDKPKPVRRNLPLFAPENIPLPDDPAPIPPLETIPLPEEPMRPLKKQFTGNMKSSNSVVINGVVHDSYTITESIALPAPENIPLPEDQGLTVIPPLEMIPLPEEPRRPLKARVKQLMEKPEEKESSNDTDSKGSEVNGDASDVSNSGEYGKIPHVESIPLPEDIPSLEGIPLPEEPMATPAPARDSAPSASRFGSTGLFSGIFANFSQPLADADPVPSIIKSAIDRTTSLDNSLFDKSCVDELKSVQEILTRVSNMDSNNSVLVSGVLQSAGRAPEPRQKPARANDPRLHPPPQDKPKPVRRKLSITEYRKRHRGAPPAEEAPAEPEPGPEWSSESSSLSPQRLDAAAAAAADDLEQRLHRELSATHLPKGVFDAQPTASERQRENLSSRLRREFGLALPDDSAQPTLPPSEPAAAAARRVER